MLILLVFKKYKNIKKNQIYKKKEVEGPSLEPNNIFAYKYWSSTHTKKGGAILHISKKKLKP
jgi:hypothetical protein